MLADVRLEEIPWRDWVPRYLVPFEPGNAVHYFTDVLIIGGGLAGLRTAIELDSQVRAVVVTKDVLQESNSTYAQGGIASVWDPEDRFDNHVQDTLVAGGSLCHPDVVETVVREAPEHISDLMAFGTQFDSQNGHLVLGREGGHSHQRIIHALGDATGKEIMRAMMQRVRSRSNIQIWEETFTIDLLTFQGRCRGALVSRNGQPPMMVWASQSVLCTGGCGQLYRETTNPRVATGDGHALAFRAGAAIRDMEFMQFHPTVLYIAGSSRTLITEAVRGEGAYLVDHTGYRFMGDYDHRLELAPRDIVSQSIVKQMEKTRHPCVYLTMKHLDADYVRNRFPGIAQVCRNFGLDIAVDPIPVRPGAHYMLGGVSVDLEGRTTLPGLWAAGEVTSSGLHGANRLASNSLLEGLVFGKRCGIGASSEAMKSPHSFQVAPIASQARTNSREPFDIADIRNAVQSLMWRQAGVQRDQERLQHAFQSVANYSKYVLRHTFDDVAGWELQNLLTIALLLTRSALERRESRGVHARTDFPCLDEEHWCRHISIQRVDGE